MAEVVTEGDGDDVAVGEDDIVAVNEGDVVAASDGDDVAVGDGGGVPDEGLEEPADEDAELGPSVGAGQGAPGSPWTSTAC